MPIPPEYLPDPTRVVDSGLGQAVTIAALLIAIGTVALAGVRSIPGLVIGTALLKQPANALNKWGVFRG